jgi:hypothetical protein
MEFDCIVVEQLVRKLEPSSFAELADILGEEPSSDFEEAVCRDVLGIREFLNSRAYGLQARDAQARGDKAEVKKCRVKMLEAIGAYSQYMTQKEVPSSLDDIIKSSATEVVEVVQKPQRKQRTVDVKKKAPGLALPRTKRSPSVSKKVSTIVGTVPVEDIDCIPMRPCVLGVTSEVYHGRPVVVVRLEAGMFGTANKESTIKCTLHKGILNQCAMKSRQPTPYWVVLDTMSHMGSFTKDGVIQASAQILESKGVEPRPLTASEVKAGKKERTLEGMCRIAFDVLKNHHNHPKKINCAMSHIVDTYDGMMKIRGRGAAETRAFFEAATLRAREMGAVVPRAPKKDDLVAADGSIGIVVGKNG